MQIECIFGMKLFEGKRGCRSASGTKARKVNFITVLRRALLRSMAEAAAMTILSMLLSESRHFNRQTRKKTL
jgi:hypothetical protein